MERKRRIIKDLTGQTFGRWTVLEKATAESGKPKKWICQCSCENHTIRSVLQSSLLNGCSLSCGCLNRERTALANEKRKKLNKYDLTGEYGIGYTSKTKEPFYFDLEDYDKIKNYTWNARHCKDREGYYIETAYKGKRIHLHHLVLGINDLENNSVIVDHKNRVKFDCRKENLQITNNRVNNINKNKQTSNSSGIIGVSFSKTSNKWVARICTKRNKRVTICYSKDKEEAIIARLVGEYIYYKKDAPQKHLFEEYGITEDFVKKYKFRYGIKND